MSEFNEKIMGLKYKVQSGYGHRGRQGGNDAETAYGEKSNRELAFRVILVVVLGIPLALFFYLGTRYLIQQERAGDPPSMAEERLKTAPPMLWQGLQPGQIVDKFLAASTPQERLRWVRQPAAVADLMERFY